MSTKTVVNMTGAVEQLPSCQLAPAETTEVDVTDPFIASRLELGVLAVVETSTEPAAAPEGESKPRERKSK